MLSESLQHLEEADFFCDFFSNVAVPIERMDSFTVDQNKYSYDACLVLQAFPDMTSFTQWLQKNGQVKWT